MNERAVFCFSVIMSILWVLIMLLCGYGEFSKLILYKGDGLPNYLLTYLITYLPACLPNLTTNLLTYLLPVAPIWSIEYP
jgi:hypothetical protein